MKRKLIFMAVMVLAFGIVVAGCSKGTKAGEAEIALNGTWEPEKVMGFSLFGDITFKDGNYEMKKPNGDVQEKGIFKVENNLIMATKTHDFKDGKWVKNDGIKFPIGEINDNKTLTIAGTNFTKK